MRTVKVDLPEELADRAARVAADQGTSVDEVVAVAVAAQLQDGRVTRPVNGKLGFVGLGSSMSGRRAAEVEDMLAEGFGRD